MIGMYRIIHAYLSYRKYMSVTLAQLKQQSRERADMQDSQYVTDSELTSYINNSLAELHDIIIQSYDEEYFVKDVTFNTTANVDTYALSSFVTDNDFYKVRGVDAALNSNEFYTIQPFNFNDRNKYRTLNVAPSSGYTNLKFRLIGNSIKFIPTPDANTQIKFWYVPKAPTLVDDTDTVDDINMYTEYVILDATIKMLQKQEVDVSVHLAQKAALKRRIEEASNNREVSHGDSISDINNQNGEYYYYR